MRKPPHTTVRFNQLWVRMYVPAEVRSAFDGKTIFMEQIGNRPANYDTANAAAAHWIASWKRQIRKAREAPDWVSTMTTIEDRLADDALEIMTEQELRDTARMFLASLKKQKTAIPEPGQVAKTETPFLLFFDEWKEGTHLKGKSRDQAASDIKQFGEAVSSTLEGLSGRAVQTWIEGQLKSVSAVTVRRKLSALKSYWQWLTAHQHAESHGLADGLWLRQARQDRGGDRAMETGDRQRAALTYRRMSGNGSQRGGLCPRLHDGAGMPELCPHRPNSTGIAVIA
jgi:hypothetical protein